MTARATLAAGLAWLHDIEQPDDAIIQPHGVTLRAGDRQFRFAPSGWMRSAVIVVDTTNTQPLEPGELKDLTAVLAELGAEVTHTWNGHPSTTGSLALERPSHPTLVAAVARYQAGCQRRCGRPLCSWDGCPWYRDGYARLVMPTLPRETAQGGVS